MKATVAALALTLLAGCATPLRPDPSVPLAGDWEVTAVDGQPTGGGERFILSLDPRTGWAQFGCNAGGGSVSIANGWFVAGDPWIITAASCPNAENWIHFERKGFHILGRPLAVQRSGGAVRLRNERGSIELRPLAPARLAGTRWTVLDVNGQAAPGGVTIEFEEPRFGQQEFEVFAGCNSLHGVYRQEADVFSPGINRSTERGCDGPDMAFEDRVFFVMRGGNARIERVRPRVIRLTNARGWILLERAR